MSELPPKRYHPALVAVHWLIALLAIMSLAAGKFMMPGISPDDPQKAPMLQFHTVIGGVIAVLLIARLVIRFKFKRPAEANEDNAVLRFIASATHVLLYLLLIGMAASGLGLFQMANLPAVFSGAQPYPKDFFDYLPRMGHEFVSTLLLLLILLHAGAALYHQIIKKDNLMARMWFGKN